MKQAPKIQYASNALRVPARSFAAASVAIVIVLAKKWGSGVEKYRAWQQEMTKKKKNDEKKPQPTAVQQFSTTTVEMGETDPDKSIMGDKTER